MGMTLRAFYFGCVGRAGHYLHDVHLHHADRHVPDDFPMKWECLDGGLFPRGRRYEPDGHVFLNFINGWTIATFNDRSVDSRPASNSNFIVEGRFDWGEMKALIEKMFPTIYQRFSFPLIEVEIDE